MKITEVIVTPIAIPDVPLANTKGVHQSVFLRSVIQVKTDTGLVGLAETYGAARTLDGLRAVQARLEGLDPYDLRDLRRRIEAALPDAGGINAPTALADHKVVDVVYSAFEIACLDLRGKEVGRPIYELLGGATRKTISFGGYLFFKFEKQDTTFGPDIMGEVMTPDALVAQAQEFVGQYGFKSLKLKGGVLEPDLEVETMLKLRETFPHHPLRIDPMGAWTVPTALKVIKDLGGVEGGVLEYLEDPCRGMEAMAELSAQTDMPLATNLVVVEFEEIFEAVKKDAVQIVLSDHHYWRGATGAVHLGDMCRAAGLGVSMHSNSHLGISLAAMCHVAAATPNLTYDCDTHYPWSSKEIVKGGRPVFRNGTVQVPEGPGLGVELDHAAVAELHDLYERAMVRDRDDTDEMLKYIPNYVRQVPRW
ncbi:enolase C-terminal domain-like protein [Marinovum sp. 2_MG-2023]|uniref:enolase C-terminal domain-like protein n=1 Tax=unclassified Marinovum TaxID=2647166 RepID=UPI0026E3BEAF|nr:MULTISPECIES: enolase C-terminal domain-like protein [unclassified Marinovum]MDO6732655.1 enolase C-terminal domain-like protein [Marinovum sp. 2_MG-2023]MDO6781847.1 enolase C-terminal domain-like protein [Marinovum sp. 1_MG-2023]